MLWLALDDAPAASHGSSPVIDLLVILSTAALVAIAMQRVRLAVIPAYLVAGALAGPGALKLVGSPESLQAIARLAIVLLMFGIGMHLHVSVLGRRVARLVVAGVGSCAASVLVGWPVAAAFGLPAPAAMALCMALSLSSTAVVLRLITDRGGLRHASGQLALSILVVQDLIVLAMLAALPAIARWAQAGGADEPAEQFPGWGRFASSAALRIGGVTLLIVLGKLVLPRLLKEAARDKSGEIMMIISIAVALGAGLATQALGFSMELGAFLAGFLLSATPFRHQLSGQIAPLRDLFMAVFFTTLGMQLDPGALADSWWILLLGGAAMSILKAVAIGGTCWALGATASVAVAVGLALAQGGEFSLVYIGAAQDIGVLSDHAADNAIAIVVISLILTPALIELGERMSRRWTDVPAAPWIRSAIGAAHTAPSAAALSAHHVILGGYGQVGGAIGQALQQADIAYTVVEVDPKAAQLAGRAGCHIVFGDVSNPHVLDSAGLEHADAIILTMPDEQAVLNACAIARRRNRHIFIAVRMGVERHRSHASQLGADHVTVEELETARALQAAVMAHFKRSTPAE